MKYGFTLPGRGPLATPDHLVSIAKRGEELGYHMVLFGYHIVVPRHITSEEMLQHMEAMATQVWPRVEAGEE